MTTTTDRGNWMQTYTGRAFYPLDPRPTEIDPVDIAHALAHLCRFGGHVTRFYSVAEHCVLMSHAVPLEDALWALLHDATEAYVGDMVRPLKLHLDQYRHVEDQVMDAICRRFRINPGMPDSVKAADNRILINERRALLGEPPMPWWSIGSDTRPLPATAIEGWSPIRARNRYLKRLHELVAV